jgi:hypothetical protein
MPRKHGNNVHLAPLVRFQFHITLIGLACLVAHCKFNTKMRL